MLLVQVQKGGRLCNPAQTQFRFGDIVEDMGTVISPDAVAVRPPADLYAERLGRLSAGTFSSHETSRVRAAVGTPAGAGAALERGLRHVFTALGGLGEILMVAFAFPLAILAVGIPIALFVRLGMWIVRVVVR